VDATHIGVLSFVYSIPAFRNASSRVTKTALGGWEISGVWSIQSGFPLNITLGGTQGTNGIINATNVPVFNGVTCLHGANRWFTTDGFATPAMGAWGNYKFGDVRGPGRNNWNLSLFKSFPISEERDSRFELRIESFNTFNHTQFNGVGVSMANTNQFGIPTSVWDPRQLQFGAKLMF
jgi:hypothetical protein